jgi:hypothetical protein
MASTYTPLGIEKMATGENSGTWGDKTNNNLDLIEQLTGGFKQVSIAGGAQTTALTVVDGNTTGTAQGRMIEFTGTITGNQIVTIPLDVETFYFLRNSTTGSFTVQFKYVSGSGTSITFATDDKGDKLLFAAADDVTNPNIKEISLASPPGGSDTQVQFNDGGSAFGGSDNFTWDGSNLQIGDQGDLRLGDADNSNYIAIQAPATVASNVTLTLPDTDGDADQALTTNGSGVLSWTTISGGASWQAVITADPANAVAGNGYFCNTTGGAFTVTLPTAATIGDFISFIDYAGTFDTNNLTIGRNGHNIQGAASDLTVATERAGFTLVYVDSTQGWLLQNN